MPEGPSPVACDYAWRKAFFLTTMERRRIEQPIPCKRNATDSHPPERNGQVLGPGEWQFKVFSSEPRFTARTDNRPNDGEVVKEILTPRD